MSEFKNTHSTIQGNPSAHHDPTLFLRKEKPPAQDLSPTGVLAIHIKKGRNLKILDSAGRGFSKRLPVNLYIKVGVGETVKMTSVTEVRCGNTVSAIFDDFKHFSVTINNKLDHESNKIKFVLMGFQGNDKHKKLGEKEVHLFNIIKNLFIVETLDFMKNAHIIGEVDMEIAFCYGCFGYGFSSQLESKTHNPTEQISQSLFFRAEPPLDRKHETKDIMSSIPIPHPPFINWPVQVDLTSGGRDLLTDSVTAMLTGKNKTRADYPHLLAKMNKRMPELQRRYAALNKRSQRLTFLQNLVTTKLSPDMEESNNDMLFHKDSEEKKRSEASLDHHNAADDEEEDYSPGLFGRLANLLSRMGIRRFGDESHTNRCEEVEAADAKSPQAQIQTEQTYDPEPGPVPQIRFSIVDPSTQSNIPTPGTSY